MADPFIHYCPVCAEEFVTLEQEIHHGLFHMAQEEPNLSVLKLQKEKGIANINQEEYEELINEVERGN